MMQRIQRRHLLCGAEFLLGGMTTLFADWLELQCEQGILDGYAGQPVDIEGCFAIPAFIYLVGSALAIAVGIGSLSQGPNTIRNRLFGGSIGFCAFFVGMLAGGTLISPR